LAIEKRFLKEVGDIPGNMSSALSCFLEYPEMQAPLPASTALPTDYAKVFPLTAMARIRRENTTATVFGGSDWHLGYGVSSGLSANPAFFKFRKGQAVLDSVRLSTGFFNLGFFYSEGLKSLGANAYELAETLRVPYHLPLPKALRNPQGDYKMSPDGRYYSKMDFGQRPSHFVTLTTKITVHENKGAFDLDFDISGYSGVPITLELCFRPDGTLAGVSEPERGAEPRGARTGPSMENEHDSFLLKDGFGSYTVGADKIEFGPGAFAHSRLRMEGENYAVYNGNNRAEGLRVYLTGLTPFKHTLTIK
jgi:hypothetical protein